jgi:hypothetical protein
MADQQSQSVPQLNAAFLNERSARLDAAIGQALSTKMPAAPPKAQKGAPAPVSPGASGAARSASAPAAPVASESPTAETLSGGDDAAALAAEAIGDDPGEPATDGAQEDPAAAPEGAAVELDRAELAALAKKRDLRGIEKLIGLEEGALGATNGEYAALRRRQGEVETRAAEVEQKHEANNQTLIKKFGPVVDLVQHAQGGNLRAYVELIQRTTGVPIALFVQHWSKNMVQVDPQVLELQRKLAKYEGESAPAPAPAPTTQTPEAAIQKADAYIAEEAKDHPALKLKDGAKEAREKWLAGFDRKTKSFKLSPKAACDAVVAERKAQREQESWLLSGKTPPKRPTTKAISRTGASETQVRKQNLSREELIERGAAMVRRAKAADAARTPR